MKLIHAILTALALAGSPAASAHDVWTNPFHGVRLLQRTTPTLSLHATLIDLTAPGIRVVATAPEERGRTVSSYAESHGLALAVNAGFFSFESYGTHGVAVGGGRRWTDTRDQTQSAQLVSDGRRVELVPAELVLEPEAWMKEVVSGHPILVNDGRETPSGDPMMAARHPRTAAGLTRDGRTLILLVVDGRSRRSVGMTGPELSGVMIELGAWKALNLDGGGSSAMYLQGRGIVNRPSDGRERRVGNHLGIYASARPTPPPEPYCGILPPLTFLHRGQSRTSCDGRYRLVHQDDGNVVLYDLAYDRALWHTGTHGRATTVFAVQDDGNVVLYDHGRPLWHSRTHGYPGSVLAVQDDGNLVVYRPGNLPIWASRTARRR